MSHKTEFPNALHDLDISFLSSLNDISWHNDMMPSFLISGDYEENNEVKLWIDYADEEQREEQGYERFVITFEQEDILCTNDIDEVKQFLRERKL